MFSRIHAAAVLGVDAYLVEVETDLEYRLPSMTTVGLAEGAVRESKERVSSAIRNSGFTFPQKRVTVNLAPADIRKEGSGFDLPIAVGILTADGHVAADRLGRYVLVGELSLDGALRHVPGMLAIAMAVARAGFAGLIVPSEDADEAAMVRGIDVLPARRLSDVVDFLNGQTSIDVKQQPEIADLMGRHITDVDVADVKGQAHVKRALEIAAAGSHNVLLIGPPGSGKTMLARRIPTILPAMSVDEALETTKIHSVAGLLHGGTPLVTERPFRDPHHTVSEAALIGGGTYPHPGEVSLAHNGVLFLDELPELGRKTIESLRQPLEDGTVTVSRSAYSTNFPASFMLVAAMNPCPCGYLSDDRHECTCTPVAIQRYMARVSGPILDRIDLHVDVPAVRYKELADDRTSHETSRCIRGRVDGARAIQHDRFRGRDRIHANNHMGHRDITAFCRLDERSKSILERASASFGFSARAYHRILKVARTIADLDASADILARHISEAVQYRTLDRNLWIR